MSDYGEAKRRNADYEEWRRREQETITRTADGKYLLLQRDGLSPLRYGDHGLYSRILGLETVFWLLNAAGSGVIGTLAYDALKQLIEKSRKGHEKFLSVFTEKRRLEEQHRKESEALSSRRRASEPTPARISPDTDLRDDLVQLTYDILARYRNLGPLGDQSRPMSEIDVFLTERMTWMVLMRELRASDRNYVEIDLTEDMGKDRYQAVEEIDGFPVRIWS